MIKGEPFFVAALVLIEGIFTLIEGILLSITPLSVLESSPMWQESISNILKTPVVGVLAGLVIYNPLFDIVFGAICILAAIYLLTRPEPETDYQKYLNTKKNFNTIRKL